MQTYNRAPSVPRKGLLSYFLPFLIIIATGILAVLVYNFFFYTDPSARPATDAKAYLSIEQEGVKIKPWGESSFASAHNGDTLYMGDTIATEDNALIMLKFFDKSIVRLGANTELSLKQLTNDTSKSISLELKKGEAWFSLSEDPAEFMVNTTSTLVHASGTTFSLSVNEQAEATYVMDGKVTTSVLVKNDQNGRIEPLQKFEITTGEQLLLTKEKLELLKTGKYTAPTESTTSPEESETTPAQPVFVEDLSDSFRQTTWFTYNATQDGQIYSYETEPTDTNPSDSSETEDTTPTADSATMLVISSPEDGKVTNKSSITVTGTAFQNRVDSVKVNGTKADYNNGAWSTTASLPAEGENTITVVAYDPEGAEVVTKTLKVKRDTTAPAAPVITAPSNGSAQSESFSIKGTTTSETQKIIVTGSARSFNYSHILGRYLPGEKTWLYNANVSYGNLAEGDNTFRAVAIDAAGNISEAAEIKITYTPKEEPTTTTETTTTTTTTDSTETPTDTTVTTTDTTETTTTTTTTDSTETPEEPATAPDVTSLPAPLITIPTAETTYKTALPEIAIGGTVNQSTAKIYVNGTEISYTAGSTRWNNFISLERGENKFSVVAEAANGVKSPTTTITIIFE
jgi:hypothetical protein